MIIKIDGLLDDDDIYHLFDLYRRSNNIFLMNGVVMDRHVTGVIGCYVLSRFSEEEVGTHIWQKIISGVSNSINSDISIRSFRFLRYQQGSFIPKHTDFDDVSLVVQLSQSDNYSGGLLTVENEIIKLNPGDAVGYSGEVPHSVSNVTRGVRYVLNIRLEKVK